MGSGELSASLQGIIGALGFCGSSRVPGSATKPSELRSGVLQVASQLHRVLNS